MTSDIEEPKMAPSDTTVDERHDIVVVAEAAKPSPSLESLGGSVSDDWNTNLAEQLVQTLPRNSASEELQYQAALAALIGIGPKDEIESMMAAQSIAAHNATMECYRRAADPYISAEARGQNLAQATKLCRAFAALLEALSRYRGKGHQKVTVEHVHVHAGGQAVVGVVQTPGGGGSRNLEEQPHAKQIGHAPEPAVRRKDEVRDDMPFASNAERAVPDARRPRAGRTKK